VQLAEEVLRRARSWKAPTDNPGTLGDRRSLKRLQPVMMNVAGHASSDIVWVVANAVRSRASSITDHGCGFERL